MQADTPVYQTNDCAVVAVALLAGTAYNEALETLRFFGRKDNDGAFDHQILHSLKSKGHEYREYTVRPAKTIKTLTRWWCESKRWSLRGPYNLLVTTHDHTFCYIGTQKIDLSEISENSRIEAVWLVNKKKWQEKPEKNLTSIKYNL
jgi:hypothetical protein